MIGPEKLIAKPNQKAAKARQTQKPDRQDPQSKGFIDCGGKAGPT